MTNDEVRMTNASRLDRYSERYVNLVRARSKKPEFHRLLLLGLKADGVKQVIQDSAEEVSRLLNAYARAILASGS